MLCAPHAFLSAQHAMIGTAHAHLTAPGGHIFRSRCACCTPVMSTHLHSRQHQRTALPLLRSGSGCAILPLEPVVLGCVSRFYTRNTRSLLCLEGNGVLGAACVEGERCFSFAPPSQLPINSGPLYRVGTPI